MQQGMFVVLALFVAPAVASSMSTETTAKVWLETHSPTDDQLGALKNANPGAYAMVKALLAKKSMGLIKLAPSQRGPDVFRRMMNPSHYIAAQPEAESEPTDDMPSAAAQPQIRDQLHFDPKAAADKDESMVNNLLDAVAGLGGKQHKKLALLRKRHRTESVDPFAQDMADFGVDEQQKQTPPPAMEAPQVEEQAEVAPKKKANSYLAGLDMSGDMPVSIEHEDAKPVHHTHTQNLLESESLSFQSVAEAELAAPQAQQVVVRKPKTDNSFMNWLGMTNKAPASQEEKAVAKGNSYSALLS